MSHIRNLIPVLLAAFALGWALGADEKTTDEKKTRKKADPAAEEVRQAIDELNAAVVAGDLKTVASRLGERYFHTSVAGLWDRAECFEKLLIPLSEQIKAGDIKYEVARTEDLHVEMYGGDTAIAVGRFTLKRSNSPRLNQGRFTHVWVKEDGRWKRAAYHSHELPERDRK